MFDDLFSIADTRMNWCDEILELSFHASPCDYAPIHTVPIPIDIEPINTSRNLMEILYLTSFRPRIPLPVPPFNKLGKQRKKYSKLEKHQRIQVYKTKKNNSRFSIHCKYEIRSSTAKKRQRYGGRFIKTII